MAVQPTQIDGHRSHRQQRNNYHRHQCSRVHDSRHVARSAENMCLCKTCSRVPHNAQQGPQTTSRCVFAKGLGGTAAGLPSFDLTFTLLDFTFNVTHLRIGTQMHYLVTRCTFLGHGHSISQFHPLSGYRGDITSKLC